MKGKGDKELLDYIYLLGRERYKQLFSFAFVRNPWDRLVSWYSYDNFGTKDFSQWLHCFDQKGGPDQIASLVDDQYTINVKFIGRFERLQEGFDTVCNELNIPPTKLPLRNKSKHENYPTFYNETIREFVANRFAAEIEMFGYAFDQAT